MAKAKFSFFLKGVDKQMDTLCIRLTHKGKVIRLSTGIKFPAKFWNQESQSIIRKNNENYTYLNEQLSKLTAEVERIFRVAAVENQTLEDIRNEVAKIIDPNFEPKAEKGVLTLYRDWATFGTATRLNPDRQGRHRFKVFEEFVSKKDIPFEQVDYSFYSDFIVFLRTIKKYKENTVGSHIRDLKAVMNEGLKRKLHKNEDFKNFKKPAESVININLTENEIDRLRSLRLSGLQEQVRDIFIVGCYVAQRHSDYSTLSNKDIMDGRLVIIQEKTKHRIMIPIHPIVDEILKKYDGQLPHVGQVVLNREIKKIAAQAMITEPVFVRYTKCGQRVEKYVPKCELITSHTARKSGVTNALRAGVPIEDCMYLAGIYDIRTFKVYAGVTDEEYSQRLAGSKFFAGENDDTAALVDYAVKIIKENKKTAPEWLKLLREEFGNILIK